MKRRDLFDLVTLGLLWGLGFLFIHTAVPEFGAVALIEVRMLLAAALLLPLLLAQRRIGELLANWRAIVLMGLIHYAVPFCLLAWAMLTLPGGYSSLVNAASPLFAGIVARAWIGERLTASRVAGLVLGMGGVALLLSDKLFAESHTNGLAVAAAVAAPFCYGFAAVLAKRKLSGLSPIAIAGGSMAASGVILLPVAIWLWPAKMPSADAWGMAAALGGLCTAFAFVLYFRLIASTGPSRAISVTFLVPVFAMLFGALLANEVITSSMLAGGIVIALGTALTTGLLDIRSLLRRSGAFAMRLVLVVMAACALGGPLADADAAELSAPIRLSANTFSSRPAEDWETFSTFAASSELEVVSADRSRVASVFAEYHMSGDARVDGTTFAGVAAGYRFARWDATGYWFAARFPGHASRQSLKLRVRRRLREGHKFGVEYVADVEAPGDGELELGYYAAIRPGLTLKLLLGADLDRAGMPLARLGISWQAR